jgi:hypothetical protein
VSKAFDRKLPILEVVWSDCQLFVGGWEPHADVMRRRGGVLQRSVGYVLADDKMGVVLTSSLSQGGNVYGTVNIPAGQIVKRKRLR